MVVTGHRHGQDLGAMDLGAKLGAVDHGAELPYATSMSQVSWLGCAHLEEKVLGLNPNPSTKFSFLQPYRSGRVAYK